MKPINKENLKAFAFYMQKTYDFKIVTRDHDKYKWLKFMLRFMRLDDNLENWLSKWWITFPGHVWSPVEIGSGLRYELEDQIFKMCHETIHVKQWRRDRAFFVLKYALSKSFRTEYEIKALQATMEMMIALGYHPNVSRLAGILFNYKVRVKDVEHAQRSLEIYYWSASQGARANSVVKDACKWWEI
jgi:hypothetical protein